MRSRLAASLVASLLIAVLLPPIGTRAPVTAAAQELPTIPAPVPVTVDPATTALLVLDFNTAVCPPRPGCVASLPAAAALLDAARRANLLVVYSSTAAPGTTILPEVAPLGHEPVVVSSSNKFYNTALEEILTAHGITTTIMMGTAANGAVLYTAFDASLRGFTSVVAEDGISGTQEFDVFLTRYQLLNQPGFANPGNEPLRPRAVTLSRTDLISFGAPAGN